MRENTRGAILGGLRFKFKHNFERKSQSSVNETNNVPDVTEPSGDDSLQNFFKGTAEDRPLIDAPDSPN